METSKSEEKKLWFWSDSFSFLLFLYELYRREKEKSVPFHQCQLFVVCVDFEWERQNSKLSKSVHLSSCWVSPARLCEASLWSTLCIAHVKRQMETRAFSQRTISMKRLCCLPCTECHIWLCSLNFFIRKCGEITTAAGDERSWLKHSMDGNVGCEDGAAMAKSARLWRWCLL